MDPIGSCAGVDKMISVTRAHDLGEFELYRQGYQIIQCDGVRHVPFLTFLISQNLMYSVKFTPCPSQLNQLD